MGLWVVDKSTGLARDYSDDGTIRYDDRFHDHITSAAPQANTVAQDYRYDGANIILRSDGRRFILNQLRTAMQAVQNDVVVPSSLKTLLQIIGRIAEHLIRD